MIGVGLSVGLSSAPQSGAPASPNPQLLLWSEALDNPVWVTSGAVVTPNAANDPDGQATADRVNFDPFGTLIQTTTTAAATGDPAQALVTGGAGYQRADATGIFDGAIYHFSAYVKNSGSDIVLTLRRAGGFLEVEFQDSGDGASFDIAWCKLETPSLTDYVKREGT